jgi:hypothetical protein
MYYKLFCKVAEAVAILTEAQNETANMLREGED